MHAGMIPKENHLYETLRWSSTADSDSCGRDSCGVGVGGYRTQREAAISGSAQRKIPIAQHYMKRCRPACPADLEKKKH